MLHISLQTQLTIKKFFVFLSSKVEHILSLTSVSKISILGRFRCSSLLLNFFLISSTHLVKKLSLFSLVMILNRKFSTLLISPTAFEIIQVLSIFFPTSHFSGSFYWTFLSNWLLQLKIHLYILLNQSNKTFRSS